MNFNIPTCFKDLIGGFDCNGVVESTSGVSIHNSIYFSLDLVDKISKETIETTINKLLKESFAQMLIRIKHSLSPYFIFKPQIHPSRWTAARDTQNYMVVMNNNNAQPSGSYYGNYNERYEPPKVINGDGLQISYRRCAEGVDCNNDSIYLYIQKVRLRVLQGGGRLVVSDGIQTYVYNVPLNNVPNVNNKDGAINLGSKRFIEIEINRGFFDYVSILYYSDGVEVNYEKVDSDITCYTGCNGVYSEFIIDGISDESVSEGNIVSALYALKCDFDSLLCEYANDMAMLWRMMFELKLIEMKAYTPRLSFLKISEGINDEHVKRIEKEIERELKTVVDTIRTTLACSDCINSLGARAINSLP